MNRLSMLSIIPLLAMTEAQASSNDAWQAQEKDVVKRCLAASQLQQAKVAGEQVLFDDRLGVTAVMISGRYPQAYMKGQRGRELCLYQRATGKVFVSEADRLLQGK